MNKDVVWNELPLISIMKIRVMLGLSWLFVLYFDDLDTAESGSRQGENSNPVSSRLCHRLVPPNAESETIRALSRHSPLLVSGDGEFFLVISKVGNIKETELKTLIPDVPWRSFHLRRVLLGALYWVAEALNFLLFYVWRVSNKNSTKHG